MSSRERVHLRNLVTTPSRRTVDVRDAAYGAVGASYAALVGIAFYFGELLPVLLVLGPVVGVGLIRSASFRLLFFVVGGLLTLGVSATLGPAKLGYAAGVIVCAVVSALRLARADEPWLRAFRPLLYWSAVVQLTLVAGVLASDRADLEAAVRLGVFYVLVLVAPIIGLDAGRDCSVRAITGSTIAVGTFAALAFGVNWIARRGVATGGLDTIAAPSLFLPTYTFGLAFILALGKAGQHRRLAVAALAVIPVALVISGNRTSLLFAAVLLSAVGNPNRAKVPPLRAAVALAGVVVAAVAALPVLAATVLSDPQFLERRIRTLLSISNDGLASDMSYLARVAQVNYAMEALRDNPWLGNGVGYGFGVSIDNGLATVVRIGVVGTVALVLVFVAAVRAQRRLEALYGHSPSGNAFVGTVLVIFISTPLTSPIDDRGLAMTMCLAFAGVSAWAASAASGRRSQTARQEIDPTVAPVAYGREVRP